MMPTLLFPFLIPVLAAVVTVLLPKKYETLIRGWTVFVAAVNLIVAVTLFGGEGRLVFPWGGWFEFSLRLYHFSSFILLATAGFAFLIALYCFPFMKGKENLGQFF
jgi:formate hydrogenlyase subunit 3/multisubunit Na+/H+ antiporter MnhD subunit